MTLENQLITFFQHTRVIRNVTKKIKIMFASDETIKNLSSYKLAEEKVEILNYGLKHPIEQKH